MVVGRVREVWRFPVKSMGGERLERSEVGLQGFAGDRVWAVRHVSTGRILNAKRFPILLQCSARCRVPPRLGAIPHVDVTLPDGTILGSDAPALAARLSELVEHDVALHAVEPASNRAFYRRLEPGSALMGRVAKTALGRQLLQWGIERGAGGNLRQDFGRTADEPLPDLRNVPPDAFEFQTPPGTYFDLYPIHLLTTAALDAMSGLNPSASWDVRRFRPNVLVETPPGGPDQPEQRWQGEVIHVGGFDAKGAIATVRCAMPGHAQRGLPSDPSVLRAIVRQANQCLGLYASVARPGEVSVGEPVTV